MAWVTGVSCITALGNTQTTWQKLLTGECGIRSGCAPVDGYGGLETLLLAAVQEAVGDRVLPPDCAVVVGSSRHYQQALEAGQWVLPAQLSAVVAQRLGVKGRVVGLSCACSTGNWVVIRALELLETCSMAIVACADRPITPLTLTGFKQMGILAQTCHPFSQERQGMVVGEGAGAMVLEAVGEGIRILGWGCTNDASHVSTPDRSGVALKTAIGQCLQRSGISSDQIDLIFAHGTGTPYNDAVEAAVMIELFPHQPWISAVKGAIGHSLGAAGLIESVLGVLMIQHQTVLPVVGLRTPAFPLRLPTQAESAPLSLLLNLSLGFGGQNTVLCFGKP
jgi:3-oxoacyl-[acyl-carrier-protein] synthase II